ncbi:MAG: hypothetical protein MUE73_05160 [Planctomycetes bacterium]|jgi:hypothetical protein|nr:hypothetical protein [Planctomycetota bacterium]
MSRVRAFIHVAGPKGAGKTAFVEALLRGLDEVVICVRGVRLARRRDPEESGAKDDPELRRYRMAGASEAVRYRFGTGREVDSHFFEQEFMQDHSTAVVIEGDCPVEAVELPVFVLPVLPPGETVVRGVLVDGAAAQEARQVGYEKAFRDRHSLAAFVGKLFGMPGTERITMSEAVFTDLRAKLQAEIEKRRVFAPGCEGLAGARLVVVNVRAEDEATRAEALRAEVAGLRGDRERWKELAGRSVSRRPVTVVVARLSDLRDAGTRKAVARVRKAVRSAW